MLFQNPNIDLTLGSMYRCDTKRLSELEPRGTSSSDPRLCFPSSDCYENSGLYHALQLETMFNINSFLNRTVVSLPFCCW